MIYLIFFLISFGFYLGGVSPTVYGGDSGEFIASATFLGIPHAPGYPTYVLLSKISTMVIPFGNISYRVNLLSGLINSFLLLIIFRFLKIIFKKEGGVFGPLLATIMLVTLLQSPA